MSESRDPNNLTIYIALIETHDLVEYRHAGGAEPVPLSRVLVRFDDDPRVHESGFYVPDDGELPRVFIHRRGFTGDDDYRAVDVARESPDPLRELIWFAHELGHHQAVLPGLGTGVRDENRPTASYAEEVLAWRLGRQVLQGTAFSDWDEFDRVEGASLRSYELGFKLDGAAATEVVRNVDALLATAG
jgi:hypothetical protein